MKTRISFVSNSSSSSFIVIPQMRVIATSTMSQQEIDEWENTIRNTLQKQIVSEDCIDDKWSGLCDNGEKKFGWQTTAYYDIESKWNWMALQACYGFIQDETFEGKARLDRYLDSMGLAEIDWEQMKNTIEELDAYIDHQSVFPEDTFEEIDRIGLTPWLYDGYCFVHNGNDNG